MRCFHFSWLIWIKNRVAIYFVNSFGYIYFMCDYNTDTDFNRTPVHKHRHWLWSPFIVKESWRWNAQGVSCIVRVLVYQSPLFGSSVRHVYTALLRLSTALDRFIARREILTQIHLDCGTNYVVAACKINFYLKVQKCRIHVSDNIHESHISGNIILLHWNTSMLFRRIDDISFTCRMGIIVILGHMSQRWTIQTVYAPWHGEIF